MKTDIQPTVSKTANFTGAAVDVSSIAARSWTLFVKVVSFTAGQSAVLTVEDSVDNFASDVRPVVVQHVVGGTSSDAENLIGYRWHQAPDTRFGTASAKLRIKLNALSGGSITYSAWVES